MTENLTHFNMNQSVKVKLTPFGEQILKDRHEALNRTLRRHTKDSSIEIPFNITLDENGYYSNQLWSIMNTFGQYIGLAAPQPFETDIILIK